jgi:hypothetical protein
MLHWVNIIIKYLELTIQFLYIYTMNILKYFSGDKLQDLIQVKIIFLHRYNYQDIILLTEYGNSY